MLAKESWNSLLPVTRHEHIAPSEREHSRGRPYRCASDIIVNMRLGQAVALIPRLAGRRPLSVTMPVCHDQGAARNADYFADQVGRPWDLLTPIALRLYSPGPPTAVTA